MSVAGGVGSGRPVSPSTWPSGVGSSLGVSVGVSDGSSEVSITQPASRMAAPSAMFWPGYEKSRYV